jgi:hypothetical protein
MPRSSEEDLMALRTSLVSSDFSSCGTLLATLVNRSFPPKDSPTLHLKHVDFDKGIEINLPSLKGLLNKVSNHAVQKIAQDFLQLLVSDVRLPATSVANLLRVCVDSPWIGIDSLQRFSIFCFNILLTSIHEKDHLKTTIANQVFR